MSAKKAFKENVGHSVLLMYVKHYEAAKTYIEDPRHVYDLVSGCFFSAMALEAYANHLGETVFNLWDEAETKLSFRNKMKKIYKSLHLEFGHKPILDELIQFRNRCAHSRSTTGPLLGSLSGDKLAIYPEVEDNIMGETYLLEKAPLFFQEVVGIIKELHQEALCYTEEYDPRMPEDPFDDACFSYVLDLTDQDDPFKDGLPKYHLPNKWQSFEEIFGKIPER